MGQKRGLRTALAAAIVSSFSLIGIFNASAADAESPANSMSGPVINMTDATPQAAPQSDAPLTLTIPSVPDAAQLATLTQEQLDTQLSTTLAAMENTMRTALSSSDAVAVLRYQPPQDPALLNAAQTVRALLAAGANPNAVNPADGTTLFGKIIWMAQAIDDSELVRAAVEAGADPLQTDGRGWNAIDHILMAINQSQRTYRGHINTAIEIYNIVKDETGVTFRQGANFSQFRFSADYTALAINIVALDVLRQNGMITDDRFEQIVYGNLRQLRDMSRQITEIDPDFFTRYGATLADYPDAAPGGPEEYTVKTGDTLETLGYRFMHTMDAATPEEAASRIAALNSITVDAQGASRPLVADETLMIPVAPEYMIGQFTLPNGRTLQDIAPYQREAFFRDGATTEDVLRGIARLNGLDEQAVIDGTYTGTAGEVFFFPFHNAGLDNLPQLTPPPSYDPTTAQDVYMVVVESQSYHGKQTLRTTMNTGYAINPNVDLNDFFALDELLLSYPSARNNSDALKMLLDLRESGLNERVVFSHSMAINRTDIGVDELDAERDTRYPDDVTYESLRLLLEAINEASPIIFNAAGNWYPKDGPYVQSYAAIHSPRSVNVGAVGQYRGLTGTDAIIVSPYSNGGADVCEALPFEYRGRQMEGTSFATPSLAAQGRQFLEWYGNVLTFEEIMAVALMTADRNMLDIDIDPQTGRPVNDRSRNGPFYAEFQTNGAGLPFHTRCGAGFVNIERWEENLRTMVELKQAMQNPADELHSFTLQAGAPAQIIRDANGEITEYVYRIAVPQDMTVGKLTFMTPQYQGYHSDVRVRMPSGFESTLLRTTNDIVSTSAFNYEDVQQGQYIELRSQYALGPTAGVILRGQDDGNAIQAIREHLRGTGILPAPLQTMAGNTVLENGVEAPRYRRPFALPTLGR